MWSTPASTYSAEGSSGFDGAAAPCGDGGSCSISAWTLDNEKASSTEPAQAWMHIQCQIFDGSTHIEVSTVLSSWASSDCSSCTGSGMWNWNTCIYLLLCQNILQAFLTSSMSVGCWACQGATYKTTHIWKTLHCMCESQVANLLIPFLLFSSPEGFSF